jgi:hypothetical protein
MGMPTCTLQLLCLAKQQQLVLGHVARLVQQCKGAAVWNLTHYHLICWCTYTRRRVVYWVRREERKGLCCHLSSLAVVSQTLPPLGQHC